MDPGDFLDPAAPIAVRQLEDFGLRPMEVIRNIGYLLIQPLQGVA
jgi:hypothetical protein